MSIHIYYEIWLLLISMATGVGLMIVYDLLRLLRMVVKHNSIWVGAEDLAYWIYAGLMTFTLLYRENDGNLRGYVIVAVFTGMMVYDVSISRFFFKLLKKCEKYLKMKKRSRVHKKM